MEEEYVRMEDSATENPPKANIFNAVTKKMKDYMVSN
jgi:hypothetical protein